MRFRIQTAVGILAALLLCGLSLSSNSAAQNSNSIATKTDASDVETKRAVYCTKTGGLVEYRKPYYNTNSDPSQWLVLAGGESFCQYTRKSDGSRIHISLSSLYAKEPSLAVLAYYAQVPWNGQGNGNPASFYCTQLGGSDSFGGVNPFGGGWVKFDVTTITCPVTVLHGEMDKICNVVNARHTAEIVPNARLALYNDLGHFSIATKLIPTVSDLLTR